MKREHGDRVEIVVVARETAAELRADPELAQAPVTFLPEAGHVFEAYRVSTIPRTFLFDGSGNVVLDLEGYSTEYEEALKERLGKMTLASGR
jgi:hypothetical protein